MVAAGRVADKSFKMLGKRTGPATQRPWTSPPSHCNAKVAIKSFGSGVPTNLVQEPGPEASLSLKLTARPATGLVAASTTLTRTGFTVLPSEVGMSRTVDCRRSDLLDHYTSRSRHDPESHCPQPIIERCLCLCKHLGRFPVHVHSTGALATPADNSGGQR